jgi:hypothetical protein
MCTDSLVPPRVAGGRGLALAGFGGLALGLTVLASIGSLGMLLPAFPLLAVLFVARRAQAAPFGLGLFAGIGIGIVRRDWCSPGPTCRPCRRSCT